MGNTAINVSTVHAVSKGCAGALLYLDAVPWNTSQTWLTAYPTLTLEVAQDVNAAWNLHFDDNRLCNCTATTMADASNSSLVKLNGSEINTVNSCDGVVQLPVPSRQGRRRL